MKNIILTAVASPVVASVSLVFMVVMSIVYILAAIETKSLRPWKEIA